MEDVPVSTSGRPFFKEQELEFLLQQGVLLHSKKTLLRLTSHRLFFQTSDSLKALELEKLLDVNYAPSGFFSRPTTVKLSFLDEASMIQESQLTFPSNGERDNFLRKLEDVRNKKAWANVVSIRVTPKRKFDPSAAGFSGIRRLEQKKQENLNSSLTQAFTDLKFLIEKAKDLVAIANTLQSQVGQSGPENNELQSMMENMGIPSPVTRSSAGDLYYTELAKQLFDFLKQPIEELGGSITLTDAYCLFNRARGTALISPEDMRRCSSLFAHLGFDIRLHEFESGVLVLQSVKFEDEQVSKKILETIEQGGPQTAMDLATSWGISAVLAKHYLLVAETRGLLCRDESIAGLIFYPNFFREILEPF
eukprot:TRINITY_DN10313_c0_g1_i1.p1 TRINITY_DN10313_c0_g1~~TRINITY_DN10313_c0_g1_i1.p1  ORF type:complete len:364 (-),score=57.55 TRINITY_DN10313_c0_g1_i1:55-1146(-)